MPLSIAPLFSGSKGNSIYIGTDKSKILVDAGYPASRIEAELRRVGATLGEIDGILVTHEHTDHIAGVGSISRMYDIPVYANEPTWFEIARKAGEIKRNNIRVIDESDFYIGDLCIQPFEIPHDAAQTFAYSVTSGGKKVCVMTDLGQVNEKILQQAAGSSIVLLESNHDLKKLHDGPYPAFLKRRIAGGHGHLSNAAAAGAALELVKAGVRGILLGHLSETNNEYELALETVCGFLKQNGAVPGRHVAVALARREGVTGIYAAK